MMSDLSPRETLGGNFPPLDPPETVAARLEREHKGLFDEAAALELERFGLPQNPSTDAEAATLADFVVKAKGLARRIEDMRVTAGKPYLEAGRAINLLAKELTTPIDTVVAAQTAKVGIYNRAKAERERAERLALQRAEEARAAAAYLEAQRQRDAAEAAERRAQEAAAEIRQAETARERASKEQAMRDAETAAVEARAASTAASQEAAQAERKAEVNERAASGDTRELSRVSSGGSTSSVSKRWSYTVADIDRVRTSLGPLGPWLPEATITDAIARAVREQSAGGARPSITIPGVDLHLVDKTNISAAR